MREPQSADRKQRDRPIGDRERVDGPSRDDVSTILWEDAAERNKAFAGLGTGKDVGASVEDPLIGQVLDDKYRLDEKLGEGGMGVVYKARHLLIDRSIAIKVLRPNLANREVAQQRFRIEARLAGGIFHGNIVGLTDFGQTESDILYVAMELLEGESLRSRLTRSKRFPFEEVVHMMLPIAEALAAAHDTGICHRDVKPENIFMATRSQIPERPMLLDFGIAKRLDRTRDPPWTHTTRDPSFAALFHGILHKAKNQISRILDVYRQAATPPADNLKVNREAASQPAMSPKIDREAATIAVENLPIYMTADEVIDESLTRTGTIMGTPLYMSPEQLRGQPIDYRTDIYSFSAVVYEMLSGSTPIVATTKGSFINQLLYDQPSPFAIALGVPPVLEELVRRGLAKNRDERPQNMKEVIEGLQHAV